LRNNGVLYGSTQYHRPSRFIAEEIPPALKEKEGPIAPAFPKSAPAAPLHKAPATPYGGEFARRAFSAAPAAKKSPTAFQPGDKVKHLSFGMGEILSVRPMGGDTLYEIRFEGGTVKKLMATYAKLTKL
jgi:DNA helicase-2/ATP-dependent DNA helicase PcrA